VFADFGVAVSVGVAIQNLNSSQRKEKNRARGAVEI